MTMPRERCSPKKRYAHPVLLLKQAKLAATLGCLCMIYSKCQKSKAQYGSSRVGKGMKVFQQLVMLF